MSLATDLSTLKDAAHARMPKEQSDAISKSVDDFMETWSPANAINVGQPFPDFSLSDATGKQVSMKELLAKDLCSFRSTGEDGALTANWPSRPLKTVCRPSKPEV